MRSTSPGAQLVARDFTEVAINADRLDDGGRSTVTVRVAGILSYTVLKTLMFQDRHKNKDAYDLVYCLLNYADGPYDAGRQAKQSPIAANGQTGAALELLAERFAFATHDGPSAYSTFLDDGDPDAAAQLRQEAVAVVREFLDAFHN